MPGPAQVPSRYFLDHDGRVFLVREGRVLRLPARDEVDFAFLEKRRLMLLGKEVVVGSPVAKHERPDWVWKDELPGMVDVDPLVRAAANLTLARVVAKGAFTRGPLERPDELLLVRPLVGFYRGQWSLPGGYLDYGETPEECLVRETLEELGVHGSVVRLLHLGSRVVPSGVHFLSFLFEGRLHSEEFHLKGDEIEDARWFPLEAALREVEGAVGSRGLEALRKEGARER